MPITNARPLALDDFRRAVARGERPSGQVEVEIKIAPTGIASERRVVSATFTDKSVDSYGDTVEPTGVDLTTYRSNPLVLFGHDATKAENVIGRAFNVRVQGNSVVGEIEFATAEVNPHAEVVWQLVNNRFLNAVSIGFEPLEYVASKSRPGGIDFKRIRLREISIVPLPANANALIQARAAGIDVDRLRLRAPANDNKPERSIAERRAAAASLAAEVRGWATPFVTVGEFLRSVAAAEHSVREVDSRLIRAPAGANISDPTTGGFLVPTTFANDILRTAYDESIIAQLVTRPALGNAPIASVKYPGIDETSRASGSRYGGLVSYWAAESDQAPSSFPRFKSIELSAKKLFGVCTVSNELLQDAALLDLWINRAFGAEFGFKLDLAIFSGTAGTPLGILNSPALITVPKEVGQAASTVVAENFDKMFGRLPITSRRRAVWLVHEDVDTKLPAAFSGLQTYQPAGANGSVYATVHGRPVMAIEQASTLGTVGDVVLADLSHYLLLDGGITPALSVHFRFDSDQSVFRFVLRCDGAPEFTTPVTAYSGSTTRSPFVTLQSR